MTLKRKNLFKWIIILSFLLPIVVKAENNYQSNGQIGFYGKYVPNTPQGDLNEIPSTYAITPYSGNSKNNEQTIMILPRLGDVGSLWIQQTGSIIIIVLLLYLKQLDIKKKFLL
ncbi:hypothetical protein [Vagococcus lutrae]|uniref:hypothetical protein n=1 Tax=Vagococcus lutrae TaxID=81947 RepID=UPI000F862440|nr:hypothetical protein [Vagococcus lutrae]RST93740.1 hypothetical protein CBF33_00535 [Vagococcus lutrae]